MYLLQERDKASCIEQPERLAIIFLTTFFLEKMFERGGNYDYDLVRRWRGSDKFFASKKNIIPFNFNSRHWLLFVANISERRIEYV
jgi:Ulp1 family protease